MSGLIADQPSAVAWPVVRAGLNAAITIPDDAARDAMRLLAEQNIIAGETGAASLGGLLGLTQSPDATNLRSRLHLDKRARVLIIVTEGATDPKAWESIVGKKLPKS